MQTIKKPGGGARKPFDRQTYDKYNTIGIDAVGTFLHNRGNSIKTEENYKADIRCLNHTYNEISLHEVEVRAGWHVGDWPLAWNPVNIPYRKKDIVMDGCFFWIVRNDGKRAIMLNTDNIRDDLEKYLEEFKNKAVEEGEYFYRIPYKMWIEVKLV